MNPVIDLKTPRPGMEEFPPTGRALLCSVAGPIGSTITLRAKVEVRSLRCRPLRGTSMHNAPRLVSYRKSSRLSLRVLTPQETVEIAGPALQPRNSLERVC
jgi:hypothetical protein